MPTIFNLNYSRLIAIARGDNFEDFVARELQHGDLEGVAGHEIAVEDAQNGFVGDDEQVVLFAFELEDDGFEADGEVMV